MRARISYLEGPIQHLYPLDLSYDKTSHAQNVDTTLNPVAPEERKTKQNNKKKKAKIGGGRAIRPCHKAAILSRGTKKVFCFTTLSLIPMVSIARLSVVKQSSFGLPGQYGRRVTRVNPIHRPPWIRPCGFRN